MFRSPDARPPTEPIALRERRPRKLTEQVILFGRATL